MVSTRSNLVLANAFVGYPKRPTSQELADALGRAKTIWDSGLPDSPNSSNPTLNGTPIRPTMAPDSNAFRAAFALGDKAVKAAPQSKLPQRALKMIKEAKKYPEGTAVRIEVKKESEPPPILTLAAIKLEN